MLNTFFLTFKESPMEIISRDMNWNTTEVSHKSIHENNSMESLRSLFSPKISKEVFHKNYSHSLSLAMGMVVL